MIVSHRHRFIFLKTRKTAGTSIEIALSPFCGPDDILAPLSPADETLRMTGGQVLARNYLAQTADMERYAHLVSLGGREALTLLRSFSGRVGGFYNHMPAREVKPLLPEDVWQGYYKFTVERNPWDQMVSRYYWKNRTKWLMPSFSRFLRTELEHRDRGKGSNFDVYAIDGAPAVDHVMRYEQLSDEMRILAGRIGLGDNLRMPNAKGGKRRRPGYRELYNAKDRAFVAQHFAREIELMGYEF